MELSTDRAIDGAGLEAGIIVAKGHCGCHTAVSLTMVFSVRRRE